MNDRAFRIKPEDPDNIEEEWGNIVAGTTEDHDNIAEEWLNHYRTREIYYSDAANYLRSRQRSDENKGDILKATGQGADSPAAWQEAKESGEQAEQQRQNELLRQQLKVRGVDPATINSIIGEPALPPIEAAKGWGPEVSHSQFVPASNLGERSKPGHGDIPGVPDPRIKPPQTLSEDDKPHWVAQFVKSIYPQAQLDENIVAGIVGDLIRPLTDNPAGPAMAGGGRDLIQGLWDVASEADIVLGGAGFDYELPEIDSADEGAAHLVRAMTQFFAGFGAAGGLAKGASFIRQTLAGGFADVLFDPELGNLSTLLREQFNWDNVLVNFLDAKVGEDADALERLESRAKMILEGGGIGALIPATMAAWRSIKHGGPGAIQAIKDLIAGRPDQKQYQWLVAKLGGEKQASEYLASKGISGIKDLAAEGARINVLEQGGVPGHLPGAPGPSQYPPTEYFQAVKDLIAGRPGNLQKQLGMVSWHGTPHKGPDPRPVAPKSAGLPDMEPITPERELYQSVKDGKVTADDFFIGKPETELEQRIHGAIEQRIKDVSEGKMVESEKLTLPTSITGFRKIAHTLTGEIIDGKKMSKAALTRQVDEMLNPDKQRLMMPQEPRAAELKHLVYANGEKVQAERTEILSGVYGDKAPVKGMRPEGTVTFKDIKRAVHATVKSGAVKLKTAKKVLEETYGIKKLMKSNLKMEKAQVGYKRHGVNKAKDPLLMPDGRGVETTGLSLYHAYKEAKISICAKSASCVDNCLATTSGGNRAYGGGVDKDALKGPRKAHFMQNQAFIRDPEAFIAKMDDEVGKAWAAAQKNGNQLGIRLNVLSDVPPTVYEDLMTKYPDVQFYDYTKLHSNKPIAPNHHLTYSSTGTSNPELGVINLHQNWRHMTKKLDEGHNVAMPFTVGANEPLPKFVKDTKSGKTYKVIDGDVHDYRPADDWGKPEGADGYIVGLRNKDQNLSGASRKKAVESSKGFFTYYDPAKGDTAEIAAQSAKGTGDMSKVVLPSAAFLMQFPHWEKYNPELAAELEQGT
jgi:hypothetical protein